MLTKRCGEPVNVSASSKGVCVENVPRNRVHRGVTKRSKLLIRGPVLDNASIIVNAISCSTSVIKLMNRKVIFCLLAALPFYINDGKFLPVYGSAGLQIRAAAELIMEAALQIWNWLAGHMRCCITVAARPLLHEDSEILSKWNDSYVLVLLLQFSAGLERILDRNERNFSVCDRKVLL